MTMDELWQQFEYRLRIRRRSTASLTCYDVTR